jgi:hypothetical protein
VCAGWLARRPFCFLSVLEIGQEACTLSIGVALNDVNFFGLGYTKTRDQFL